MADSVCRCGGAIRRGYLHRTGCHFGQAAGMRQKYAERKAQGLCAHAGCPAAPVPGRVRCARHLAMVRAAKARAEARHGR